MKNRPVALLILALMLIAVALSFPVQILFARGWLTHGFVSVDAAAPFGMWNPRLWVEMAADVWANLSQLNLLTIFGCFVSGLYVYRAEPATPFVVLLTMLLVGFNNWWVGKVGLDFSAEQTLMATGLFVLPHLVLFRRDLRELFWHPENRWWMRAARRKVEAPVVLSPWVGGEPLRATAFDISETGVFVSGLHEDELGRLRIGEKFHMRVVVNGASEIRGTASLVRVANHRQGQYPQGVALKYQPQK